jgi:hypothetical protein
MEKSASVNESSERDRSRTIHLIRLNGLLRDARRLLTETGTVPVGLWESIDAAFDAVDGTAVPGKARTAGARRGLDG